MDYPFVHRGLLQNEAAKITVEALKEKFIGKYARNSGHDPLKIVGAERYILHNDVFGYRFIAKPRNGKGILIDVDRCGNLELIDDPTNPW